MNHQYADLSKVLKEKDLELRQIVQRSPVVVPKSPLGGNVRPTNSIAVIDKQSAISSPSMAHRKTIQVDLKPKTLVEGGNTPRAGHTPIPTGVISPIQPALIGPAQASTPIDGGPITPNPEEQNWSAGCASPVNTHVMPTSYVTQTSNPSAPELEQQLYQNQ